MVKVVTPTYDEILEQVTRVGGEEGRALVERATDLARKAHDGQLRYSEEPFFNHCQEVAAILSSLNCEPSIIAAAFLHDTVEDTREKPQPITLDQIKRTFGAEVASRVDGVTKLAKFDNLSDENLDINAESLRKLFIAMAEDVGVVLIKLADRLHNMRTLRYVPDEQQRQNTARETLEIFAPLANRLGIRQWKWELEDLGFRHLCEEEYKQIAGWISQRQVDREKQIKHVIQKIQERLQEENMPAEVTGRPKHIYSIYRKMQRKGVPFEQIFDVRGVRIIVDMDDADFNLEDKKGRKEKESKEKGLCYQVLGVIHDLWEPVLGEFDDYIAIPKENGYQSLHTAVVDDMGTIEVQIRTRSMHEVAERGVAAHWRYKEGNKYDTEYDPKIAWLRTAIDTQQDIPNAQEFMDSLKADLFQDRVYVYTPQGKLVDLPSGSTPIDFAYKIHTQIGDLCRGAMVNDKMVSLDYTLKTGDRIKIITTKRGGPSLDWLNYVKSARARTKIKQWFKKRDRAQNIISGQEELERQVRRLGIDEALTPEDVALAFEQSDLDDFYAAIGQGDITLNQLASKLIALDRALNPIPESEPPPLPILAPMTSDALMVRGTGGLLTNLARCCNPLPGHPIIGYVTRGRGVTIHRQDCANILRTRDTERLIEVDWGMPEHTYPVMIKITAYDRGGLMGDIASAIALQEVSMSSVSSSTEKGVATIYATLQISSLSQLSRVLNKLERVRNVVEVRRQTD